MDLAATADELYGLPRESFIAARDERVVQARAAGDDAGAARIAKLRKPSTAAWVINLLVRRRREEVTRLADLGEALREAHGSLQGDALRQLSRQRHELVRAMVAEARSLARAEGQAVTDSVLRELYAAFTAVLTDADAARTVCSGHLTTTKEFDEQSASWPPPAEPTRAEPARAEPERGTPTRKAGARPSRADEVARRRAERLKRVREDLLLARAEAEHAEADVDRARGALDHAERALARASESVEDLRARLDHARHIEEDAGKRAAEARRTHHEAERSVVRARKVVHDLEEKLSRLA